MTTKLIGIKDFRDNISKYIKAAQSNKARYIVMRHTTPLFEITPFPQDADINNLLIEIATAKNDITQGRVFSHQQVLEELS